MLYVVVPVYNAKKYLQTAVDSVLKQPSEDIEVVLVDDGSTDGSGDLCNAIAEKHREVYSIHQENAGVSAARNVGIEYVLTQTQDYETTYIAFLDADDFWMDNVISDSTMQIIIDKKYDIVSFSCYYSNAFANRLSINFTNKDESFIMPNKGTTQWLLNGHLGSKLFRCSMLRNNKIRFMEDVKFNEDIIFEREAVFCAESAASMGDYLHIYRMNPSSITHNNRCSLSNATIVASTWYRIRTWAKDINVSEENKKQWELFCKSLSGQRLLEAASSLAEAGYGAKEVLACISDVPFYDIINRLQVNELAEWQVKDLIDYKDNFRRFVFKHQIRGLIIRCAKIMLYSRAMRKIREKRRFPIAVGKAKDKN